ncbi:MAG TPA: hypothetical protein VF960_16120 [Chloroflexota bacterium]
MAGRLWIVNYLEPLELGKKVGRVLSETRPPGSNRLVTALVEASDPQVNRLRHQEEVVSVRPVSAPLESNKCVAVTEEGERCGKPATVPDPLWGGLVCAEHAATGERMRHRQGARKLLDSVEGLQARLDEVGEAAGRAHSEGEQVSLLVSELLLGVQAHIASAEEAVRLIRTTLLAGMKEPE